MRSITRFCLCLSLLVLISSRIALSGSTFYVDDTGGDDRNVGTTRLTAWRTIVRVNRAQLQPGDVVLFKKGGLWREQLYLKSGSENAGYITYSSYGSGAKPQIRTSIVADDPSQWIGLGNNLWEFDHKFQVDVAFISFNDDELIGKKTESVAELDQPGEFWTDLNTLKTTVFSQGNPALVFNHIEIALYLTGIYGSDIKWVTIDGLDINHCGWSGIEVNRSENIIIRNCDISYCGGGHGKPGNERMKHRRGQGINTRNSVTNLTIYRNRIWQCWDGCIALQGYSKNLNIRNVRIHHNLLGYSEYGFEFWGKQSTSNLQDIYFENNVVHHSGYGWAQDQDTTGFGDGIHAWSFNGVAKNFVVRNNIFYELKGAAFWVTTDVLPFNLDYNCYYKKDDKNSMWFVGRKYNRHAYNGNQLKEWQKDYGFDQHSLVADPDFVNIAQGDFHLRSDSPCIDTGVDAGYDQDYDGNTIPYGKAPDIGAFEYAGPNGIGHLKNNINPGSFSLEQNHPNPFNSLTTIKYIIPQQQKIRLTIYNLLGEKITDLVNGRLNAGEHMAYFDGEKFSSGIYFYRLKMENGHQQTRRALLLK